MVTELTTHTSGVNWESVATIVSSVAVIMSLIIGVFAKVISNQIAGAINKLRLDVISSLDLRVVALEQWKADHLTQQASHDLRTGAIQNYHQPGSI